MRSILGKFCISLSSLLYVVLYFEERKGRKRELVLFISTFFFFFGRLNLARAHWYIVDRTYTELELKPPTLPLFIASLRTISTF